MLIFNHHEDGEPDGESTPSECYSRKASDRPRAAFRQKSDAADPAESPPYPESLPSRSESNRQPRRRE